MRLKRTSIVVLACAALVLTASPAAAQQWRPIVRQCVSASNLAGCTQVPNFGGTWNGAISPDGRTLYTLSLGRSNPFRAGSIHVFTRNPATGALTLKPGADGCITSAPVTGCAQARGIGRPDEIMISADGRFVYVSSNGDSAALPVQLAAAVAVFRRNTTTGVLEQPGAMDGCINDDGSEGCRPGNGIGGRGAVLSPDQRNIYVLGTESLAVLNRDTGTGILSQPTPGGCFGVGVTCTDTMPRPGGRQLAISRDGKQLYTPVAGGLRVFARNTTTGALTPGRCITQTLTVNCVRLPQIGPFPQAVVISPDSRNVYLSHGDGIVTFTRNASNGSLAFRSCINGGGTAGCARSSNTSNLAYMAASPDGQDVLAVPQGSPGGFTAFARNATTGDLARRPGRDGCITADGSGFNNIVAVPNACRADARMSIFGHIRFFGDGTILVGQVLDRVVVLKRDFYPTCQSRSLAVARNAPTAIPLTCSDRNRDPLLRSIIDAPTAGTLGAINQLAGNVIYDPFNGFGGADRFTFRATAAGLAGPPAIINITVPGPKATKIRGVSLAFTFAAFSDHTVLDRFAVKGVPRGGRVRAVCRLGSRRCAGKAGKAFLKKRARGSVSLNKRFGGVALKVGSKITVVVTKRGRIGVAKVLTIRSRKPPKIVSRCVPPGSTKLRKRC